MADNSDDTRDHPQDLDVRKIFNRRALLFGGVQVSVFAGLAHQLHKLQVVDGKKWAPLANENRLNQQFIAPARGEIFDRFGRPLAINREAFRVSFTPGYTRNVAETLNLIGEVVPLSNLEIEKIVARARRTGADTPIVIATGLTFQQVAALNLMRPRLPGVQTDMSHTRHYPQGRSFGHIIGYTGRVSQRALDDDPVLRLPGVRTGKTGVERGKEMALRGAGGYRRFEVDARGRVLRTIEQREPSPGENLRLTIDAELQEQVLKRVSRERRASVVALDVRNGDVVAMVSNPNYDNNVFADKLSPKDWKRLSGDKTNPMLHRASAGVYPPGSTFKMVTALAGLEAGVITPNTRFQCSGSFTLSKHKFRCWNRRGHGSVSLHRALMSSCDVFFYKTAHALGINRLSAMAKRLGLGQSYDCGIHEQNKGVIPDDAWKIGTIGRGWYGGETVLAGIGQGYVSSTPLQLAVMTARIATGRKVLPSLVREGDKQGAPEFEALDLDDGFLGHVRRGMEAVVNSPGGTGKNAWLGDVRVAGKTGTSQVSRKTSRYAQRSLAWKERDHALFVAYVPASNPRYAVAGVVEHGESGGTAAAPLVRDVIRDILKFERTRWRRATAQSDRNKQVVK